MTTIKNSSVIFSSRPGGFPIPGEHLVVTDDATINLDLVPLNGGLLVKTIALSVDPYYRIMMDTTYKIGEPITGHIVGRVIRSELEGYNPGDYVYAEEAPFQEYAVVPQDSSQLRRIEKNAATWVQYIGVLGMVTRTAWIGFYALAKAKKIAKQQGLKVIGSTGSDEKVKYLKEELGLDAAFNYKTEDIDAVLKREGPIDIYWDHIGGKTLQTVLDHLNPFGRVIASFL
ncbi:hypothetical protein FRC01_012781 [Tulasnella sp. 417]|nr:hypothetical protein FRC01_012781 [Tulasnella sp. 417]